MARNKGPVFRVTGLPASRSDNELDAAIRNVIHDSLTEDERSRFLVKATIVPSCNDNTKRVALVEFRGGVPAFLSELNDDPLGAWQVEMGDTAISFDRHFHGFTQLYTPKPGSSISADIIAITGLDGHAYGSWRGKGNLGRMWLRNFLSEDFPYCRTMIYGYNTKLLSNNINTILDYGRGLIEEIKKIRNTDELRRRPLFFIAHSFGGIILAHCLIKAAQTNEDDHPTIAALHKATYGMLLFGIPHKGLIVDNIQRMVAGQDGHPRSALLEQIRSGSDLLAFQLADFKNLLRDRKVVSFYEMGQTKQLEFDSKSKCWKRTGNFATMVDPESALLSLSDFVEDKIPLDRDHSMMVKFDTNDDQGYTSARDRLRQFEKDAPSVVAARFQRTSPNPTGNIHWMVPRPVNSRFTGRSELLDRIKRIFLADRNMQVGNRKQLVIIGIGGQGKSEICLKAAHLMREDFWGVFWVDVGSREMAKSGFLVVAKALGSSEGSISESLRILANTKNRWLLILDNADDPYFDYQEYIPSGSGGAIIMTSRVPECQRYSTVRHEVLEGLDLQHSKQLLLKAARIREELWLENEPQARDIVDLLGSHTLALIQAGAYIAEGHCRLDQYPRKYQQQRKQLLEHFPSQEQSRYRNVYATFEASAKVLKGESGQDALDLLAILSMLYSSILPLPVFEGAWKGSRQTVRGSKRARRSYNLTFWRDSAITEKTDGLDGWHVSQLPKLLLEESDQWNDRRLARAVTNLTSLSLIMRHRLDGFDGLSMHPLAHTWAKDRLDREQQRKAWISAGCLLTMSRRQLKTWRVYEIVLRPHVQSCLSTRIRDIFLYGPQKKILHIVLNCGFALNTMREDARLESLLKDIYQSLRITPLEPSRAYVRIWDLAGRNQIKMGNSQQAVELLEYVVKVRETTLVETHPDRLGSQHGLAIAYRVNGQTKKALELLEHVVKVRETTLVETHPDRLSSQHGLAIAYQVNGQIKKAVGLLEHVVDVQKTMLAKTHPDRLNSQHQLAVAYLANRQTKEAVVLLEHVVKVRETTLAETHPSRISSRHELARAHKEVNESSEG